MKTEYASLCIPEVEFEVEEKTQPGLVTTIEGLIDRTIQGRVYIDTIYRKRIIIILIVTSMHLPP